LQTGSTREVLSWTAPVIGLGRIEWRLTDAAGIDDVVLFAGEAEALERVESVAKGTNGKALGVREVLSIRAGLEFAAGLSEGEVNRASSAVSEGIGLHTVSGECDTLVSDVSKSAGALGLRQHAVQCVEIESVAGLAVDAGLQRGVELLAVEGDYNAGAAIEVVARAAVPL
jgi:hypothetical protein